MLFTTLYRVVGWLIKPTLNLETQLTWGGLPREAENQDGPKDETGFVLLTERKIIHSESCCECPEGWKLH